MVSPDPQLNCAEPETIQVKRNLLRMMDDDLISLNIDETVLSGCEAFQASLDHGDLSRGHELWHNLAEENLGVGVLVDFIALGHRIDEIALGALGEPVPGLPRLGLPSVEVVGVSLAVDMGDWHDGTSIQRSGLTRFSLTILTDFKHEPG